LMKKMKASLTKLGSRKFQAFLIITATNIIMLVGYLLNIDNIQTIADSWMPVINLLVQAITTMVYQIVQGGVDKEGQKQQVYITAAPNPQAPAVQPAAALPTETEFETQVETVNTELNRCLNLIKTHNYAEAPADAIQLYTAIHDLIKGKQAAAGDKPCSKRIIFLVYPDWSLGTAMAHTRESLCILRPYMVIPH